MRSTFQELASEHINSDPFSSLVLGDIGAYGFRKLICEHPGRAINLGIFEQAMVGYAAGLSKGGFKPILHTIASFLIERCLEQIKVDFGYQGLPATFVSVGGSLDYGYLGATHHSPGDVAAFGAIPNTEIWVPSTTAELKIILPTTFKNENLSYVRLSERTSNSLQVSIDFDGQQIIQKGRNGTLVVIGPAIIEVQNWINQFEGNVLYVSKVSPFPIETLLKIHDRGKPIAIIEPYYQGTTLLVEPRLAEFGPIYCKGIPRKFVRSYNSTEGHLVELGLDEPGLKSFVKRVFSEV